MRRLDTDDSGAVSEIVADQNAAPPFDRVVRRNDRDLLYEVLRRSTSAKAKFCNAAFGWMMASRRRSKNHRATFWYNRERIRQMQDKALQEMRTRIEKARSVL